MKRSIALGLVLWLAILALPSPVSGQATPTEVRICELIRDLEIRVAEIDWRSCLSTVLGTTGGLCFSCIFVSGPFAIFCAGVCIFTGVFGSLALIACWQDFQVAKDMAAQNFDDCLATAAASCV